MIAFPGLAVREPVTSLELSDVTVCMYCEIHTGSTVDHLMDYNMERKITLVKWRTLNFTH